LLAGQPFLNNLFLLTINLLLRKDGNFYTLFDESIHEQLKTAANEAGLMKGNYEVCYTIRNNP